MPQPGVANTGPRKFRQGPAVQEMTERGMSAPQIAKRLGLRPATVREYQEKLRPALGPTSVDRDRVKREVEGGRRCVTCWLLLPCDHDQAAERARLEARR